MLLPLGIGLVASLAIIVALRLAGMDRDRATAPILLVSIAVFYPVFASENGSTSDVLVHLAIAGCFVVLAVLGYSRASWIVGIALIVHGVFDVLIVTTRFDVAPDFWAPFCLAVDVVLGGWLLFDRRGTRTA